MHDLGTIQRINAQGADCGPQELNIRLRRLARTLVSSPLPGLYGDRQKALYALKSLNRRAALLAAAAGGASYPADVATALSILKSTQNPAVAR